MFLSESTANDAADRWVTGDIFGAEIPADLESLLEGGTPVLTELFRAAGSLGPTGRVTAIVDAQHFVGGGTGTKAILDVTYGDDEAELPDRLFVKFSRNFADDVRDRGRSMMVSEARFAVLARDGFPVPVPQFVFADIDTSSSTGLLITACIPYGVGQVEPLHPKCLDHVLNDPSEHYAAILRGQARMAGAHIAGHLSPDFDAYFPYDPNLAGATVRILPPLETLERWAQRMFDFVDRHPQLFEGDLVDRTRFLHDLPRVYARRDAVVDVLTGAPGPAGFSHWNANIDNCWFERDDANGLVAGFIDWANAGPATAAQAVLGALSGASSSLWRESLDDLLAVYIDGLAELGVPRLDLDLDLLRLQLLVLHATSSLMGAPVAIEREVADIDALAGPRDEQFLDYETARIQLHMMTNLLENWEAFNLGDLVANLA